MSYINESNLKCFAFTNESMLKGPVNGVVLDFHGMGWCGMITDESPIFSGTCPEIGVKCAERGLIYIFPYYGPWSWMNDVAVRYIDGIVDFVFEKNNLPGGTPIVSSGGSMGGQGTLIYTLYGKRTPVACAANCPVCDVPYSYSERMDVARTLRLALGHYPGDFGAAMESISPLHQITKMPDIPYYIVHGAEDDLVCAQKHSDAFTEAARGLLSVEYRRVDGMKHGGMPEAELAKYHEFILSLGVIV